MTQVSKYPISKAVYDRIFEVFIKTLINIRSDKEAKNLVFDFFTPTERIMLSKRLGIALMLEKGYDTRTIMRILRVSAPTITAANNARNFGSEGYKNLINKILRDEAINKFLGESLIKLVSIPAAGTKGSSAWKYLRDELKKKNREKPF